jgi:hypothetical protein
VLKSQFVVRDTRVAQSDFGLLPTGFERDVYDGLQAFGRLRHPSMLHTARAIDLEEAPP